MAIERATVGETRRIKLVNLRLNGTRITSVGGGESVAWEMTTSPSSGEGDLLDSGTAVYDANQRYWYDDVDMPATAQTVFIHWTVVKSGATERFLSEIRVTE